MLFSFRITGGKAGRCCGRECVTMETDWWTRGDRYTVLSPLCLSFPTKRGYCRHQAEKFLLVVHRCISRATSEHVAVCYRACHSLFSARQAFKAMAQMCVCESHFRTCVGRSVTEDATACTLHVRCSKLLGNLSFLFFFFFPFLWLCVWYPCMYVCMFVGV